MSATNDQAALDRAALDRAAADMAVRDDLAREVVRLWLDTSQLGAGRAEAAALHAALDRLTAAYGEDR